MKEDEIKKALWEYYRVVTEESRIVGTARIKMVISTITAIAAFLTFIGLILTQIDKIIFSFNLVTIGISVIGATLFFIFILFISYLIFLKMHGINLYEIAMNIEKLQRDILFEKIDETDLKEKFQKIYPYLNAYKLGHERKKLRDFFGKYFKWRIE